MQEEPRKFPDLSKLVKAFNERLAADLEPLTIEKLINEPCGKIAVRGCLKYGLYERDGNFFLAVWESGRFSNDQFREYDIDGNCVYSWSSWYGSADVSTYPEEYQKQYYGALERAIASGIGRIWI